MVTRVNVNLANQIKLSNDSFDKAMENHEDNMLFLLKTSNMDVGDMKFAKSNVELHKKALELAELEVAKIQKKIKEAAEAKKEFWSIPKYYEDEEKKKHPRKYKTKLVAVKDV